jgi:hypothetical protein
VSVAQDQGRPDAERREERTALTFRQKQLWWEFGAAAAVLVVFALSSWLHHVSGGWANTLLVWLWLLPQLYWFSKMHTEALERTDERDREIDAKGDLSGLRLLAFGVVGVIVGVPFVFDAEHASVGGVLNALLVLLCVAQMVRAARKLRLYAGHEYLFLNRWLALRKAKRWRRMAAGVESTEAGQRWLAMAEEWEKQARR